MCINISNIILLIMCINNINEILLMKVLILM